MHFNLPDQLAFEVASYDKTRKKLAANMAAEDNARTKKKTYPMGKPSNMFPSDVIKDSDWALAVETINTKKAPEKVHRFTVPVFGAEPKTIAVVYYIKQMWVACWIPRRQDDGYVYGMTIAFRDTAAARKYCIDSYFAAPNRIGNYMFNQHDESKMLPRVKDGRTYWWRKTLFFSSSEFEDGYTGNYWKEINNSTHRIKSWGNTSDIYRAVYKWEQDLIKDIPTFASGPHTNMFTRLDPFNCVFENIMSSYAARPKWMSPGDQYVHDVDWILNKMSRCYRADQLKDIWQAKWFRSLVLNAMRETKVIHENENAKNCYHRELLRKPHAILVQYIDTITKIKCIYTDMDLNYLHSRFDWLSKTEIFGYHSPTGYQWMRDNLPVESFLNMLYQHYTNTIRDERVYRHEDSATGQKHVYMGLWRDTYEMLAQCIAAERTDNLKPRRWRLQEWHDHLMAESWKIRNPKVNLPQKLFPEPVKVEQSDNGEDVKYSFFQPIDTHQLAAWGAAVRNCVGSGHGYAEGIKKMKHIIILCMIDNKPRYTLQLTVDNGIMSVTQIADVGNARLDDVQRSNVEDAFKKALQEREKQLT
jgi:hypothetical protein